MDQRVPRDTREFWESYTEVNFTQQSVNYGKYFKSVFGSYVEAHDDLDTTNTMNPSTW